MKTFPVKLDDALWLRLTKKALDAGISLQQFIIDLLTQAVK